MEVSNATLVAYIDTLKANQMNPKDLINGTSLDLEHISNAKEKISWKDFEIITNNTFKLVGEDKALESLRSTGVDNEGLSLIRKVCSSIFRVEDLYWFFCAFIGSYFYKNLKFEYTKVAKGHVQIKVVMNPGHHCFDNFLKAYASAFEGFPTTMGLKPAKASIDQSNISPIINLYFTNSLKVWNPYLLITRLFQGMKNTSKLLNEIEEKSHQQSLLNHELEKLNQKLDKSNNLNETLIKAVMHDLNNPLTIIRLKNEKLINYSEDFSDSDKQVLYRATENMHNVLQELKDFHISKNVMCDDRIDILESLQEVKEQFSEALRKKKLSLKIESTSNSVPTLMGNRIAFNSSVISNIISNSIKFSFEGDEIIVRISEGLGNVEISFIDKGVGMNTSALNNFFNNKLCDSEEGTSGELGLGIGLTQATYFTERMGGTIKVSSKQCNDYPSDHGTEFTLAFPTQSNINTLQ